MSPLNYQAIAGCIPDRFGKLYIGYSGGIDSEVLLHLCASQAHLRPHIVAVHIHHGLQAPADDWEAHCRAQAALLDVVFFSFRVNAKATGGESPEAAAREARYRVFKELLQANDLLLLAQHREDQLETVLLQLFRGAGVQGLAAMPVIAPLGLGRIIRPLLDTPKPDIERYAAEFGLTWVEDPSNQSRDFDRNFLRNDIVPLLKRRWPSLDKTVARSARHCGEAAALLNDWGLETLSQLLDTADLSLALDGLQAFSAPQRNWLLRKWFERLKLKPPSTALLTSLNGQLIGAGNEASPEIVSQGHVFRRYRQRLFCLKPHQLSKPARCNWPADLDGLSLSNGYQLNRVTADGGGIAQPLWHASTVTLRPRSGGEKIKLSGRAGHHCLKKLFQEAGIPPWQRESRPLVYLDDRLAAVVGLWVADWACAPPSSPGYSLTWQTAESV